MCEPITIATGVATGVQAISQFQAGQEAGRVNQQNAAAARGQAIDARQRADVKEQTVRRRVSEVVGSARAVIGASGISLSSPSAVASLADTITTGEVDALTVRNNGARQAWGFESQARNFEFSARVARFQGTVAALSTAAIGSLGTFASGKELGIFGKKAGAVV